MAVLTSRIYAMKLAQIEFAGEYAPQSNEQRTSGANLHGDKTMKIDNRQVAYEHELVILCAIGRCAYLRTADVASLVWPRSSAQSAVRMAQRTLARLEQTGDLLQTKAPGGSVIYYLSEAGARRLRSEGIDAKSGKDAVRTLKNFPHRCKCNYAP